MKKILVLAVLFSLPLSAYAEKYVYKANAVDEIDIVITEGTLNITSGKTKDIIVEITPDKPENMTRNIGIDEERDLKIYLDDLAVNAAMVVNITVPASQNDIEIASRDANISVSGIKGSLNIDATNGKVAVNDFVGDFEVDTAAAEVTADGMFKKLDVETSNAAVIVNMRKIPSLYDYSVEGAGNVTLHLPASFSKARLKLERKEFYGTLNIR